MNDSTKREIYLEDILAQLPPERRAKVEQGAQELIAEHLLLKALSPILPMKPGEKPTEPGWYVVDQGSNREIVEVVERNQGHLVVHRASFEDYAALYQFTFIARIFPDRINPEE